MGLKQDALNYVFKCIDACYDSYFDLDMLELGNQMVKFDGERIIAKKYFEDADVV